MSWILNETDDGPATGALACSVNPLLQEGVEKRIFSYHTGAGAGATRRTFHKAYIEISGLQHSANRFSPVSY